MAEFIKQYNVKILTDEFTEWQYATLKPFDLDSNVSLSKSGFVRVDTAIVSSFLDLSNTRQTSHVTVKAFDKLSENLLPSLSNATPASKIYVSRRNLNRRRRIINESQLEQFFELNGFKIVRPEELELKDQIEIFSSADIVISPVGSANTNIGFCRPGSMLVEIFAPGWLDHTFCRLSAISRINYACYQVSSRFEDVASLAWHQYGSIGQIFAYEVNIRGISDFLASVGVKLDNPAHATHSASTYTEPSQAILRFENDFTLTYLPVQGLSWTGTTQAFMVQIYDPLVRRPNYTRVHVEQLLTVDNIIKAITWAINCISRDVLEIIVDITHLDLENKRRAVFAFVSLNISQCRAFEIFIDNSSDCEKLVLIPNLRTSQSIKEIKFEISDIPFESLSEIPLKQLFSSSSEYCLASKNELKSLLELQTGEIFRRPQTIETVSSIGLFSARSFFERVRTYERVSLLKCEPWFVPVKHQHFVDIQVSTDRIAVHPTLEIETQDRATSASVSVEVSSPSMVGSAIELAHPQSKKVVFALSVHDEETGVIVGKSECVLSSGELSFLSCDIVGKYSKLVISLSTRMWKETDQNDYAWAYFCSPSLFLNTSCAGR